ncbi:hypothetical protein OHC33_002761 [Knufia fluminis]|uniref:Uncharacterized protein n=1 Tax=Knufia fluminis TaxID=191047 RepID=A0AAN8EQA7_9EURO|nr:hypothetical protein OHC33_002761 [Knufia fluminis]
MSPFSRIMPHAFCCFYLPRQSDDSRHQSPIRPIPPTVPRKPAPYAMINVPHEPEMAEDVHAFRRLFTQSPACPHGSTPTQEEKPRSKRLEPRGSLDMNFNFSSGSPIPPPKKSTSIQKLGNHIKQKLSESRLSKSSSRAENREMKEEKDEKQTLDPISDANAILLGVSARSTGLSDLLRSRSGSAEAYDSDAKSIMTPVMLSSASTIKVSPEQAREAVEGQELRPDDSVSTFHPSPQSIEVARHRSLERKARSSPFPITPKRPTFTDAVQLMPDESASVALKRLSAGIADGTIKPPSENELRHLRTPDSQYTDGTFRPSAQMSADSSGSSDDIGASKTGIKRLNERVLEEKRLSGQTNGTTGHNSQLLNELDPALVEYLSRFSPKHSPELVRDVEPPQMSVKVMDDPKPTQATQRDSQDGSEPATSLEHSRADVTSMMSDEPSEPRSVHLYNMHISQRLASKSNATMLSPAGSGNVSRRSLEVPPPMPGVASATSLAAQYSTYIRAEHVRRPSDPQTRKLFEQPGQMLPPPRKHNTVFEAQGRRPSAQDDASSVYTTEGGPPSSSGKMSTLDGITMSPKSPYSLAVGGKAASSGVPDRRSNRKQHSASSSQDVPLRRLSTSVTDRPGQLEAASKVINRYVDGSCEDRNIGSQNPKLTSLANAPAGGMARRESILSAKTVSPASNNPQIDAEPNRRVSAGWLTAGQRTGWNYNFVNEATTTRPRQGSAVSTVAPDTIATPTRKFSANDAFGPGKGPSPLAESATDMWNRVYRDARKDNAGKDLLSTPTIEMDDLRRSSSTGTIRHRHRSIVSMQTPQTAIRRSHSAGPHARQALREEDSSPSGRLSKTLKRLSLRHLRSHRPQVTPASGPRKLQKRSSPELTKKVSKPSIASATRNAKVRSYRAGNTPPLKELLGIWGTFPSHDRAERNGPAGETDNVHASDFGPQEGTYEVRGDPYTPLQTRSSTGALSAMHSTLRRLSIRSKKMDRKKTKSMPFPVVSGDRVHKHAKAVLISRWKRLYRTKSSEWRGYMIAGGHRSSVSAGQPVEYPELETLSGEGLFAPAVWRANIVREMDGASSILTGTPDAVSEESSSVLEPQHATPTGPRRSGDRMNGRSRLGHGSAMPEPGHIKTYERTTHEEA